MTGQLLAHQEPAAHTIQAHARSGAELSNRYGEKSYPAGVGDHQQARSMISRPRTRTLRPSQVAALPRDEETSARIDLPRLDEDPRPLKVTAPPSRNPPAPPSKPADKPSKPSKPAAAECGKPNIVAVTSGKFLDGLTMNDYYPELRGKGYFANPDTAGPWDTGSRCGVNVQIVGSLNAGCHDESFKFTQTVHHDKSIINGSKDADDGTTHDDIADSGGDYTKPPRRQRHNAERPGKGAGSELHVSMADPPSLLYSAVKSAEWDRTFVTGLVGPDGKAEATWRASMVVKDGKVVKNTVN